MNVLWIILFVKGILFCYVDSSLLEERVYVGHISKGKSKFAITL